MSTATAVHPSTYPLDAWYPVAWSDEIGQALFARKACDTDIVLFRDTSGRVAALEDACWHRLMPLSLGKLHGDEVICGYHGLAFNAKGRCTHMPSQETINPSACVRSFPTAERDRLVWIWPGDPSRADPEKLVDFHWNDDPRLPGEGGTIVGLRCDYRLVIDNLLDLTHETFVHADSIGHDEITRAPFEVTHDDQTVTLRRWMTDIEAPPFWARQLGRQVPVDRWHVINFQAPAVIVGDVGIAETGTGAPQGDRSQGVTGYFLAALCPESETSCHYFWNFVRDHHLDDPEWTDALHKAHVNDQGNGVYQQDEAVLEAQQRAIDANHRQPFYNLNIDAGAMWARRIIERMIAAEQPAQRDPRPKLIGKSA